MNLVNFFSQVSKEYSKCILYRTTFIDEEREKDHFHFIRVNKDQSNENFELNLM